MGNWVTSMLWGNPQAQTPPPPLVLVPPIFDFPPLAARTRMLEPAYDMLFGKMALRCLFNEYFEQAGKYSTRIMLKPIDDPHVDLIATVSGPLNPGKGILGNALFRWQRNLDDPHTFMDLFVSNSKQMLRIRSCAYYPKYGMGAFGTFPLLMPERINREDYGVMGFRYGSETLSVGTSFVPFPLSGENPVSAWLVGRVGRLTAGFQYRPTSLGKVESGQSIDYKDLKHWSCAVGYGIGSGSPLSPSFNFAVELVRGSKLVTSFYQHVVVQRRVNNPFEENRVVGITNYIDFGFELESSIKGDKPSESVDMSSFQVAASWQANKNLLLKGKVGPSSTSIALAFKSWWRPSFTFNITAVNDRAHGTTSFGVGVRVEDLREASYERADPNYVMLTPNKEHLAEGVLKNWGKRPMFQADVDSGNYDHLPKELRPLDKIF